MKFLWTHLLRGAQALLAALVLALSIASASLFYVPGYYPSQSAFLAFCGAWTLLVALYFFLAPHVPKIAGVIVRLVVDAVTCLFWFAGFIALAVAVGDSAPLVGDIPGANPINPDTQFTETPAFTWFQISAAAAAFGGVEWLLFTASTTLTAIEFHRGRKSFMGPRMAENPGDTPMEEGTLEH